MLRTIGVMGLGSSLFDRVPPHDDEAERATLGGALLSADALGEITEIVDASDFYQPRHQTIFQALRSLFAHGQPVDVLLLSETLKQRGELDRVGGNEYLSELTGCVPTAANAVFYAQIVRDKAVLRSVISAGTKIAQLGYSTGSSPQEIVNLAQSQVYEMGGGRVRQDYQSIGMVADQTLAQIDRIQTGQAAGGLLTGFGALDELTQGLPAGGLVLVAGRPAMGKSTLAVDFARHAALDRAHPVGTVVFSLEMSKTEIAQRVLSAESNIPLTRLRQGDLSAEDWGRLNTTFERLQNAPLYLDDSPNMSLMEIRAKCRRLKQTHALGLVVVDYLQLMSSTRPVESRQQEVSEFSRALKLLAKELGVPVVALSQLNRGPEMRQDKRPMLSDLRESGSLEQDADMVFLVHRPDVYDEQDRPGEADIIVAKHRNGPTGVVTLAFMGATSKFENMANDMRGV